MEREALLKLVFISAEGSTRQRARVSKGRRGGRTSRACNAERRAEVWAREGNGDGRTVSCLWSDGSTSSSGSEIDLIGIAAED